MRQHERDKRQCGQQLADAGVLAEQHRTDHMIVQVQNKQLKDELMEGLSEISDAKAIAEMHRKELNEELTEALVAKEQDTREHERHEWSVLLTLPLFRSQIRSTS